MKKIAIILLTIIMLVGCGSESSKSQPDQNPQETKQPIKKGANDQKKTTSTVGDQNDAKAQNVSDVKTLSPDNSPDLNDLSLETITSIPDIELTGQDFINSETCKQTRLIPQSLAPNFADLEKNYFWSDCFPNTSIGRFDDMTKDMFCYPYVITHLDSVYIHSDIRFNPYTHSCFNIDTGELLWSKSKIQNMRFDRLSKKIICNDNKSNKTTCIEPSTGIVLWEGDFDYLESDGSSYFLAERNLKKIPNDETTNHKIVLIGEVNTGEILNDNLVEADADIDDKASFFDLYRFFNGKPTLKDSQGNNLDWNWNSKAYLALDRPEKIVDNLLLLPYCSGGCQSSMYLECYDIDSGEKKWGFKIGMDGCADIMDPNLYMIGNKILMQYVGFAMPYSYSYLFDIHGNRYEIPKKYQIDVTNKVKKIGTSLILGIENRDNYGLDFGFNKIDKIKPYNFALGGKVYTTESDFSQFDPNTKMEIWSKEKVFGDKNRFLDAIATDEWLIALSINEDCDKKRNQLKIGFYSIDNGDMIKEIKFDFLFEKDDDGNGVGGSLNYIACLSMHNKKLVIQTQIGVYILGNKKDTLIKSSDNFVADYQPPAKSFEGSGKYSTPIFDNPIPKPFTITNVSDQTLHINIVIPEEANYITISCEQEFDLKAGESKEITHSINKSDYGYLTNRLFPIIIKYSDQTESVFIYTASRFYPD